MKKSIRTVLAGMLIAPVLALGVSIATPIAQPASAECKPGDTTGICGGANSAHGTGQPNSLFGGQDPIFKTITNAALYLIGAVSVLMLIYGGVRYTISGGETANVTAAKNTILYAIVGIIVALMAYAIVNFVLSQFK